MGSSPKWPTKRWPLEHFRKLAERILERFDARIVLFGSRDEADFAREFRNFDPDRVLNLIGQTELEDLPAFFQKLHLVVSGDTALLHVAAAMDVPIAAIFGPTDPKRHIPPARKIAVFMRNLPCQPCYSGVCKQKEQLECVKRISVDEVYETCKRFLET
jgi:ADP-heptose:LPS heptosyltransferase